MKYFYRIIVTVIALVFLVNPVWAFRCQNKTIEQTYKESERAFLIYITETKLNEKLWKKLNKGYPVALDRDESIKAIFTGYRITEEFKGDTSYKPTLIDLLGIGTGYTGVTPGQYYFVMLPPLGENEQSNIRRIDTCRAPVSHYRLDVDHFQKELDVFRSLRGTLE
ncbi:MAG: hypothetical protein ACRBCK_11570 [Alphaproteobacteria bacterium]